MACQGENRKHIYYPGRNTLCYYDGLERGENESNDIHTIHFIRLCDRGLAVLLQSTGSR